jgi:hypothetical protein
VKAVPVQKELGFATHRVELRRSSLVQWLRRRRRPGRPAAVVAGYGKIIGTCETRHMGWK